MKRFLTVLAMILLLAGCSPYDCYYKTDTVTITDAYHKDACLQVIMLQGEPSYIHNDEQNYIQVRYHGKNYYLDGECWYDDYCRRIGETVKARIEVRDYGEHDLRYAVVTLEG